MDVRKCTDIKKFVTKLARINCCKISDRFQFLVQIAHIEVNGVISDNTGLKAEILQSSVFDTRQGHRKL